MSRIRLQDYPFWPTEAVAKLHDNEKSMILRVEEFCNWLHNTTRYFMDAIGAKLFHQQEWILYANQRMDCNAVLIDHGVDPDHVVRFLDEKQFVRVSFGNPQLEGISDKTKPVPPPQFLWSDGLVEVYAPGSQRVRNHLYVVLKRPVEGFTDVTPDEAVHLKATVNKVLRTLRDSFGTSAVVAQWNEPQKGQLKGRFTIEVIPARIDSKDEHNLLDKVECNNHVLFRNKFPNWIAETKPTKEDQLFWQEHLAKPNPPFSTRAEGEPLQDWTQIQTHRAEAAKKVLDCAYRVLREKGIAIERRETGKLVAVEDLVAQKKGCPFCLERVIDSQKVYETPLSYLLYNFKPATPGAHFLILPKRHASRTENLREDEVRDMHEVAQLLSRVLMEKEKRTDIKMYTQDGPSVGQTVPHSHMHLMLTPSPLRYMVFSLNYEGEIPLTREEMQLVISDVGERMRRSAGVK